MIQILSKSKELNITVVTNCHYKNDFNIQKCRGKKCVLHENGHYQRYSSRRPSSDRVDNCGLGLAGGKINVCQKRGLPLIVLQLININFSTILL